MDELIQQLVDKLGIDSDTANTAAGKAMAMFKEHGGEDLFAKISGSIPGAGTAAEQAAVAPASDSGGGGLLGSLAGMAKDVLGESAGDALDMVGALKDTGLKSDQLSGFAMTIVDFLREKLGDDTVDQILGKVPMLKQLLG
jgi:hypothetical protein